MGRHTHRDSAALHTHLVFADGLSRLSNLVHGVMQSCSRGDAILFTG